LALRKYGFTRISEKTKIPEIEKTFYNLKQFLIGKKNITAMPAIQQKEKVEVLRIFIQFYQPFIF
jgi:hypothetical protein